jgi:predicted glycosyltransferase
MRVWIDITNSPHVLFFEPIIAELRAAGHEVEVTARDYAQTLALLAERGVAYTRVGEHRGANMGAKALGLVSRSSKLIAFGARRKFDVAFSHNSNDLAVAAWVLRIPHLVVHDYEHADLSYAVNARLATRILVPESIPIEAIVAHGARASKVGHFPGLKENVYMDPSAEWTDLRPEFGAGDEDVLVLLRPAATMSAYHRFGNALFGEIVARVGETPGVKAVLLPRTKTQAAEMRSELPDNVVIPDGVYDATSLIRSADLVVSAGGTMNREAAVLGTPAYTVFAGEMGAVDRYLIDRGLLIEISAPGQIPFERKRPAAGLVVQNRSVILAELYALAKG